MIPREHLDTAEVPGGAPLKLVRRGGDHMIVLERNELMNSRMSGSEAELATLTAARLGSRPGQRWMIGGYGMGFTLRAALGVVAGDAAIDVVELVPKIIDWARGPMAALTGGCLDDPRVSVSIGDVGAAIAGARGAYDAVLLDVDNGPDGLTRKGNDALYSAAGLARVRAALRPGGILAVWSAGSDDAFRRRFGSAGFAVEEVVTARAGEREGTAACDLDRAAGVGLGNVAAIDILKRHRPGDVRVGWTGGHGKCAG